jgi:hypothetical protein
MGLLDLLRPKKETVGQTKSALEAARDERPDDSAISKLIQTILNVGLDGAGPIDSAAEVAAEALKKENGNVEEAIDRVGRSHVIGGGIGGFATGLGGFVTMPVALPVNVLEFYVQATRMVGAIAHLRGYDVNDQRIRSAILLTLIGSDSDEVLKKAGMATGGGRLAQLAMKNMPQAAVLVINKAVGFRLLKSVGGKLFSRLGRGIPVAGGVFGGGVDGWMMKKIADQARKEFPTA